MMPSLVNKLHERLFNYRSENYATKIVDSMRNSINPLVFLFDTLALNGWPIELAVLSLYLSDLTNFRSAYFKLHRMFSIALYGSRVLFLEWLLIALMSKRKNHLIESDWLMALSSLLTRLLTTVMLFQHLSSMIKLGCKLNEGKLFEAKVTIASVLNALLMAQFATIYEKTDLIIIPAVLMLSSCCIYLLARNLERAFRDCLCPMLFDEA